MYLKKKKKNKQRLLRIQEKRTQLDANNHTEATNQIGNKTYKERGARLALVGKLEQKNDTRPKKAQYTRTHLHLHTRKHAHP